MTSATEYMGAGSAVLTVSPVLKDRTWRYGLCDWPGAGGTVFGRPAKWPRTKGNRHVTDVPALRQFADPDEPAGAERGVGRRDPLRAGELLLLIPAHAV